MNTRKCISGMLAMCLTLSMFTPVLAASASANNMLSDGTIVEDDAIVLRTMEDIENMSRADEQEYAEKINKIDSQLKKDFEEFNETINPNIQPLSEEDFIDSFLNAYPEYKNSNVDKDISVLKDNVTADLVRDFFKLKKFDLALALFNHSLTDNPAKAYLDLIGNTDGIYGQVRDQLSNKYDFVSQMVKFSRAGSNQQTIENSSDYVFSDKKTDMYWAIHGFTWKRTRTLYNKAFFKIIDVYDFNKGTGMDIPGIVAGMAGTNDFDVEIYGLVQNGSLQ